jgi:Na+/phosphate symporter
LAERHNSYGTLNAFIIILATISLFLHGLNGFSKEVKQIGSDHFKVWIAKIISNRFGGFFMKSPLFYQ